LPPSGVIALFS